MWKDENFKQSVLENVIVYATTIKRMKPRRRKEKKERVLQCPNNPDKDAIQRAIQTADSRENISDKPKAGDQQAELLSNNELANKIFVGNISYRVSCNTIVYQSVFRVTLVCLH